MLQSSQLLLSFFLVYQISIWLISAADISAEMKGEPADSMPINFDQKHNYCLRNVTYYEEVAVNKTRQVKDKQNFIKRMFNISPTYKTQHYVVMEKIKRTHLVNECCEGYTMADNKICKPLCKPACTINAYCHAPNECRCRGGYDVIKINSIDHCSPRCNSGCPFGGWCTAPDVCRCAHGYRSVGDTCVQKCDADDVNCEGAEDISTESTTYESTDSTLSYDSSTIDITIEMEAAMSENNFDNDSVVNASVIFPSQNCTCSGNATCQVIIGCTCPEGFIETENGVEDFVTCAPVIWQGELLLDESNSNAFLIIVGMVVIISTLALLALKLWRHQRGSLDVEGKTDMCCKYEKNSASSESGHGDMI
ncbi:uncharacterized protein NimC4 [Eurosta solidaginis]|uniref:uncharacterized protein NimC4 n=1 Tax=Eurosta solidaginis TaxID=178769 RepID=UPI003530F461